MPQSCRNDSLPKHERPPAARPTNGDLPHQIAPNRDLIGGGIELARRDLRRQDEGEHDERPEPRTRKAQPGEAQPSKAEPREAGGKAQPREAPGRETPGGQTPRGQGPGKALALGSTDRFPIGGNRRRSPRPALVRLLIPLRDQARGRIACRVGAIAGVLFEPAERLLDALLVGGFTRNFGVDQLLAKPRNQGLAFLEDGTAQALKEISKEVRLADALAGVVERPGSNATEQNRTTYRAAEAGSVVDAEHALDFGHESLVGGLAAAGDAAFDLLPLHRCTDVLDVAAEQVFVALLFDQAAGAAEVFL